MADCKCCPSAVGYQRYVCMAGVDWELSEWMTVKMKKKVLVVGNKKTDTPINLD